ncbi:MAG: hypothetical protein QW412_02815 [Candidatus Aenigmatarchaeota archaeon]
MDFFELENILYKEERNFDSKLAESLVKIAEFYWEKIPLEKKKRLVLRHDSEAKILAIEYIPKTSVDFIEYDKKDYIELKKKVEIRLEEEVKRLLDYLHKAGTYSRIKVYFEKSSREEVLMKMGHGKKVYEMLKKSMSYLFTKEEKKVRSKSSKKLILITPFFFLIAILFAFPSTGFFVLPSQLNPIIFLSFLLIFLLLYLFLY